MANATHPLTLVTGASGFIGGHIARLLAKEGRVLRLLLRKNSPLKHLQGIDFEPVTGDIRDADSVKAAMRGVEVVYHVAALFALWARRKEDFYDINVEGTKNVCKAALEAGVKKFVYTSTTGAVGISQDPNILCDEETVWNRGWTNDPYTLSKYEAEQVVLHYTQLGLSAVILNPTGPVGPGDVHPTPTGQMICDFAKGKIPFYVDAHFSLADVRDVARGHLLAEQKGKIGERYILCGENVSAKNLFSMLAAASGRKAPQLKLPIPLIQGFAVVAEFLADKIIRRPPLITKPYAALLPYYFWFDNSKSKKELGLNYHPLPTALQDAIDWFRKEGKI